MNNYLKILLQRIDSIFKNGGSNWSSQRIMSVALVLVPLITWTIISFHQWSLQAIPESVVIILIAGLTGKVAAQYVDIKKENKNGN